MFKNIVYITSIYLSKPGNLTLIKYCFLIHNTYSNVDKCPSNVLHAFSHFSFQFRILVQSYTLNLVIMSIYLKPCLTFTLLLDLGAHNTYICFCREGVIYFAECSSVWVSLSDASSWCFFLHSILYQEAHCVGLFQYRLC